jgi:hypothetical protein
MNKRVTAKNGRKVKTLLVKRDRNAPAIKIVGRETAVICAGTVFSGAVFRKDMEIAKPDGGYVVGTDYAVHVVRGKAVIKPLLSAKLSSTAMGGFHFAPGGNAPGAEGGDAIPAINPCSVWDRNFRPAVKDPRGLMFKTMPDGRKVWGAIYMLVRDHLEYGPSAFNVEIADGSSPPQNPAGGYYKSLDYETAVAALKHHGLQLMTYDEAREFAYGVTERSSRGADPKVTGLDAPRTSATGGMQMTGNLWSWITDGHPTDPRPSIFGGSWVSGSDAGSRFADLDVWPGDSGDNLGARGRSDHLQLA